MTTPLALLWERDQIIKFRKEYLGNLSPKRSLRISCNIERPPCQLIQPLFDQIQKECLEGDFAELGVYKGATAAVLARHTRQLNRCLYLMDTFEGFDERDFRGVDAGPHIGFRDTSFEAVRARVGDANTVYIKGYFPQTATKLPDDGRYCLVHIDADLYGPIMSGLEYFYPRMVPGGFLVIHDYGSLNWPGAEKAVDTFFVDKPECVIQMPDSAGSAVIRRLRSTGTAPTWIEKRQHLPKDVWHTAAEGRLSSLLTDGWARAEFWGVWGIGESHCVTLNTGTSSRRVVIDLDVHCFVWDESVGRQVDVLVNGSPTIVIVFEKPKERKVVSLSSVHAADECGSLTIEFRPRTVAFVKDVIPNHKDGRALGVALHAIRIRSIEATE
jgi:hypothetical protein